MAEDFVASYGLDTRPFMRRLADANAIARAHYSEQAKGIKKLHEDIVKPFANPRTMIGIGLGIAAAGVAYLTKATIDYTKKNSEVEGSYKRIASVIDGIHTRIGRIGGMTLQALAPINAAESSLLNIDKVLFNIPGALGSYVRASQFYGQRQEEEDIAKSAGVTAESLKRQLLQTSDDPYAKMLAAKMAASEALDKRTKDLQKTREILERSGRQAKADQLGILSQLIYEEELAKANMIGKAKPESRAARAVASGFSTAQAIGANLGIRTTKDRQEQLHMKTNERLEKILNYLDHIEENTKDSVARYAP